MATPTFAVLPSGRIVALGPPAPPRAPLPGARIARSAVLGGATRAPRRRQVLAYIFRSMHAAAGTGAPPGPAAVVVEYDSE